MALNLYVINLPAGRVNGFDIDTPGWTGNSLKYNSTLWAGFDGVLFKGAGKGVTHIFPQSSMVDSTIFSNKFNGILKFEDVSIHCGNRKAIHAGADSKQTPFYPKFALHLNNYELIADEPLPGGPQNTAVWGCMSYECDLRFTNGEHYLARLAEHGSYAHGFSKVGAYYENIKSYGTGAEGLKHTARPHECRWVKDALIHIKNCEFKNWNQPWSWRGGAGFTAQGSGANILIENTFYRGGEDSEHMRCIMLDDSGYDFYGPNGIPGVGAANGHVVIRQVAAYGKGPDWYGPSVRIGTLDPTRPLPYCAKSLTIENSAFYGQGSLMTLWGREGRIVKGLVSVRGCNTPAIRDYVFAQGMNTNFETKIQGPNGLIPVSQGLVVPA